MHCSPFYSPEIDCKGTSVCLCVRTFCITYCVREREIKKKHTHLHFFFMYLYRGSFHQHTLGEAIFFKITVIKCDYNIGEHERFEEVEKFVVLI